MANLSAASGDGEGEAGLMKVVAGEWKRVKNHLREWEKGIGWGRV